MNDCINGIFEIVGGMLLVINCVKLYRSKSLSGVSVLPTAFFTAWGFWNLYYYPSLDQWLSFWGGLLIVVVNTIWIIMAVAYTKGSKGVGFAKTTKSNIQQGVREDE